MDKNQIADLLARYLQGEASPREKSMVEAYMLITEKEAASFTAQEKEIIRERIWNKLQPEHAIEHTSHKKGLLRQLTMRSMKTAAIWIVLLGLAFTAYLFRFQLLDVVDPIALKTMETGPYEIKQVTMPDSSIVTLSQNSQISYPVRYRGHTRNVSLNGTAFFQVKHDETAPFTVHSGELDIKVLGTSFEVEDSKSGYEASVTVVNGKVRVSKDNHQLAVLVKDQQMKYDKFARQSNILQHIDAVAATNWTRKQLVFNETPLTVVIKTLQVYYGMKIVVPDNVVKAEDTFSGSFDRNETRKEVLSVICLSSGLTYSVTKDSTVVIRK